MRAPLWALLHVVLYTLYPFFTLGDDSVCFNNCNGHGHCVEYTCHCYPGFHGDDCGTTYAPDGAAGEIKPILSVGHFNVTSRSALKAILKDDKDMSALILGFTSSNCHRCIAVEYHYDQFLKYLDASGGGVEVETPQKRKGQTVKKVVHNVKLGRVDISAGDSMKALALELGATDIPSLVVFPTVKSASKKEKLGVLYQGYHHSADIARFVTKLIAEPLRQLASVADAETFLLRQGNMHASDGEEYHQDRDSIRASAVVGFFGSYQDMEEDEYEEYLEVAKVLRHRDDLHFGVVTDKKIAAEFKNAKIIDRTPSLVLYTAASAFSERRLLSGPDSNLAPRAGYETINLDELFAEGSNRGGVQTWIVEKTVPLVGKLTHSNFAIYKQLNKPMLMLFLDLNREKYVTSDATGNLVVVGGKTGGILNQNLVNEFVEVAKEHRDRFSFVYLDGTVHEDQMRNLGLYGGAARLPSLAFNTRDGMQAPFPEELPINKDTMLSYCAAMVTGKLRNEQDAREVAKKALQSVTPVNQKNLAVRQEVKAPAEPVKGVLEHFDDESEGDKAIIKLTAETFEEMVLEAYEDKDLLLMLHAHSGLCESCGHFAVYFKKMAERLADLQLDSLVVARMDVSHETPPVWFKLLGESALPVMVLLPAGAKHPPWQFYSGVGKVGPMMKWAHAQAAIAFELPNLPHLTPEQRELYKTQVREREEIRAEKRAQEEADMQAMDALREETRLRNEEREREKLTALERSIEKMEDEDEEEGENAHEEGDQAPGVAWEDLEEELDRVVPAPGREEFEKDLELDAQLEQYAGLVGGVDMDGTSTEVGPASNGVRGEGRVLGKPEVARDQAEFEERLRQAMEGKGAARASEREARLEGSGTKEEEEEEEEEEEDLVEVPYVFG